MRRLLIPAALALFAAAGACRNDDQDGDEPPPNPNRARILFGVPTIPQSRVIDTTGTPDAERATYQVQTPFDSVARFYRRMMPELGWQVLNDLGDSTVLDLYLRKDSATVWIHVQPLGLAATEYTLLGSTKTVPDKPIDSTKQ